MFISEIRKSFYTMIDNIVSKSKLQRSSNSGFVKLLVILKFYFGAGHSTDCYKFFFLLIL